MSAGVVNSSLCETAQKPVKIASNEPEAVDVSHGECCPRTPVQRLCNPSRKPVIAIQASVGTFSRVRGTRFSVEEQLVDRRVREQRAQSVFL